MSNPSSSRAGSGVFAGLFLTTCATLLLETTLTRIFSVTLWYHFAFMAICLALFGMSLGAVLVYVRPGWFPADRLASRLSVSSILFGLLIVAGFWLHLAIPPSLLPVSFLLIALPFTVSGVIVAVCLTRFPAQTPRLYALDLFGAALGCLLLWALIRPLTGPGMIFFCASLALLAGAAFSIGDPRPLLRRVGLALSLLLLAMAVIQPYHRLMEIRWVKHVSGLPQTEQVPEEPLAEIWNTHAVVTVFKNVLGDAFGWGMSPVFFEKREEFPPPKQLFLTIDAVAATVITQFDGDLSKVRHLKMDVTALAHHLRPESDVLVIGTGGGRDLLTALPFNPRSVTGVEINADILKLVNDDLGSFTGHLDRHPKVRFANDEARSYIERSGRRYDLIQASLIDTWAATAAGAFVLTENGLYTVEAWREFMHHLTPNGVLTMSRWWIGRRPGEMVRAVSLAYETLRSLGIESPRRHVLVATNVPEPSDTAFGVGTILVSPTPFSEEDIATFDELCRRMKFMAVLSPADSRYPIFEELLDPARHETAVAAAAFDVSAPTDDRPFFFNMLRFGDFWLGARADSLDINPNIQAVSILVMLFFGICVLCGLGLFLPLLIHERARKRQGEAPLDARRIWPHGLYFAAIGLGFILVEISQLQRLTLFLGHPVYSLTVVLFTLLLATGLGSHLCGRWVLASPRLAARATTALLAILGLNLAVALGLPSFLSLFHGDPILPRLLLSAVVLAAMGLVMGMAFPIGLNRAAADSARATPWLWAINGAFSVVGSVLAVLLSLNLGITFTALAGALCYAAALFALRVNLARDNPHRSPSNG